MKFTTSTIAFVFSALLSASALPVHKRQGIDRATVDRLIPQDLGVTRGVQSPTSADCIGFNGVFIPCACPPDRSEIVDRVTQNINQGFVTNNRDVGALNFPTGTSFQERSAQLTAVLITLQNLNGPGQGCPAVATNFVAQRQALDQGREPDVPRAAPPPAAPAPQVPEPAPVAPAPPAGDRSVRGLAPQFGHDANVNPTGTGDCDGAVNGPNGQPIKIPCACPPERNFFLDQLERNVAAGFAVNNPTVRVNYAFGDSPQDINTRLQASLVTLQNLNGPGQGCPAVSTTFLKQQRDLGL